MKLASVGTYSGPAGTVLRPLLQGAQVWVAAINAKGGLHGHPVVLTAYDDGGDPARHRAQSQEAIERNGAIAFLQQTAPLSSAPSVAYVESKRVPIIGTSLGEDWGLQSPMYFPQASSGPFMYKTWALASARWHVPKGAKKFGTLACVEAQGCRSLETAFAENARAEGYQVVYKGQTSLAQPDFTAECLSAQNSGAEVLWIQLDQNSVNRVATACARQNYRPAYAISGHGTAEVMKDNQLLKGLLSVSAVFPYFSSGTPATDEYQAAMRTYGKGVGSSIATAMGWVSGKLLEKAAVGLREPPTSAALLDGLWSLRNDDLGALTAPLTFEKDRPPVPVSCWFNLITDNGAFASPDGNQRHCAV